MNFDCPSVDRLIEEALDKRVGKIRLAMSPCPLRASSLLYDYK